MRLGSIYLWRTLFGVTEPYRLATARVGPPDGETAANREGCDAGARLARLLLCVRQEEAGCGCPCGSSLLAARCRGEA
jgi:hypothetical protein